MIAVPGDTSVETIFGIIADECHRHDQLKTTAVRLIPAIGKRRWATSWTSAACWATPPVMPVNQFAGTTFATAAAACLRPSTPLKN